MAVIKYKDDNGIIYEFPLIVPLDGSLSSTSESGVQNKVLKQEFDNIQGVLSSILSKI